MASRDRSECFEVGSESKLLAEFPHLSHVCGSMHQRAPERVHDGCVQSPSRGGWTAGAGENKWVSLRYALDRKGWNVGGESSVERLDECISHDGVPCVRGVDSVEREYPAEKIGCQPLAVLDHSARLNEIENSVDVHERSAMGLRFCSNDLVVRVYCGLNLRDLCGSQNHRTRQWACNLPRQNPFD